MTMKSVAQAIGLMLAGWLFSLAMNVVDYFIFKEALTQNELWEDAISFTVLILAAHFYHLRNTCIEVAKAVDKIGEDTP